MKEIRADITIAGAGVTGLMLAGKLADLGLDVVLAEKQTRLAAGPSTRNEGWLHRGTYHATSIQDEAKAMAVARRCIIGHDQWRRFAPEAIQDAASFAVIGSEEAAHRATRRWDRAGVRYVELTPGQFSRENPAVDTSELAAYFEVDDVSVNTRILYQKLAAKIRQGGGQIFLGTTLRPEGDGVATLLQEDGERIRVRSDQLVVTAGYGMPAIYEQVTGIELPMRYWKSHLLIMPRLTQNNVFSLDPGEAALFNHGPHSIIGQHEDAVEEVGPNYDVLGAKEKLVFKAATKLFPGASQYEESYHPVACIKPDIVRGHEQARSLDIDVFREGKVIFVLPGKMTEAPPVTDRVIQEIFNGSPDIGDVALRPTDTLKFGDVNYVGDNSPTSNQVVTPKNPNL